MLSLIEMGVQYIVDCVHKTMWVSVKENREMEEVEGAQAGEFGRPPVSPEAHDGGRAPGTLHHVIVGGLRREGSLMTRKTGRTSSI